MYSSHGISLANADERIERDRRFYSIMENLQTAKLEAGIAIDEKKYNYSLGTRNRITWLQELDNKIRIKIEKLLNKQKSDDLYPESNKTKYSDLIEHLIEQRNFISNKIDNIFIKRRGVPPFAPNYEQFIIANRNPAYPLVLLSPLYQPMGEFTRPFFDEEDYQLISSIFEDNYDVDKIIESFSNFFNCECEEVVLANFNPRFGGSEIWLHSTSILNNEFIALKELQFIEFDKAFVAQNKPDELRKLISSESFRKINIFIDVTTLDIHIRKSSLPVKINRNLLKTFIPNTEYLAVIEFDYLDEPCKVEISSVFDVIQNYIPEIIVKSIYALRSNQLELIPADTKFIWTYAENILFGVYPKKESKPLLYKFHCKSGEILPLELNGIYNSEEIISIYKETLEYLKIDGFDYYNPDDFLK